MSRSFIPMIHMSSPTCDANEKFRKRQSERPHAFHRCGETRHLIVQSADTVEQTGRAFPDLSAMRRLAQRLYLLTATRAASPTSGSAKSDGPPGGFTSWSPHSSRPAE